uniref:F-box domain-containing protein n=1 Tax=Mycena chlorophos TaxID=658473 RepID=A0ABQ0L0S4_MYCCL|nr:predicted protein [Mycena chlorophos]
MFRDICQPILFHTRHTVIPPRRPGTTPMELERALALCKERFLDVAMHPRLAHYVRSFVLMDQLKPAPHLEIRHLIERFQASVPTHFVARLAAFVNLRSLRLYRISLLEEGRRALDALSLVDLQLNGCTIASGRRLPLERLTVSSCFNETEVTSHEAEPSPLLIADPHTLQAQ